MSHQTRLFAELLKERVDVGFVRVFDRVVRTLLKKGKYMSRFSKLLCEYRSGVASLLSSSPGLE